MGTAHAVPLLKKERFIMAKVVDITEKLEFNEPLKIKIKNEKIEVNSDATTVIKLMGCMDETEGIKPSKVMEMFELLFNKKERKKLEELNLSFNDLQVLIEAAMTLVTGEEVEEVGE